jgi:hypothetical protein
VEESRRKEGTTMIYFLIFFAGCIYYYVTDKPTTENQCTKDSDDKWDGFLILDDIDV